MKMPLTFVMPAYNAGQFIGAAIDSVQAQTVEDWRLIVVDDGSTDDTATIAGSYAERDRRITVLEMDSPSGTVLQPRKKAILSAETEYVSPLDADDVIPCDYLEKLISAQAGAGADIVYPTMWSFAAPDFSDARRLVPLDDGFYGKRYVGREVVRHTLDGWQIGAGGGLIRRSLYLEAFSRYGSSAMHGYADELVSRHLLMLAGTVVFSDAKYFYRANPSSVTHNVSAKRFHYLINNCKLIDFCRSEYTEQSAEYVLAQRQLFHGVFDALKQMRGCRLGKDRKEVLELVRQCRGKVDRRLLKGTVSRRYMSLLGLPIGIISLILSIHGRFGTKK